uniref:Uncharacterized protein n=1 Tax=virus sp. ct1Uu26 TaxID=2826789 RepID=A0A8S5R8P7_9VIRU|nr:MAG TPA: hypothetical protein [virus sp. ct1Uu26]
MDTRRNLIQVFLPFLKFGKQEGTLILRRDLPLCGYLNRPDREQCVQGLIQSLFDHF